MKHFLKPAMSFVFGAFLVLTMGAPAYAAPVTFTFNNLNDQILLADQDFALLDQEFEITNNTGQTWTDFHLELDVFLPEDAPPPSGGISYFFQDTAGGSLGFDGDVYEGPGTDTLSSFQQSLDIVGLSIPDGDSYMFNVDVNSGETTTRYNIVGRPTVDGETSVPLPGTIVLVAVGLIVGGVREVFARRRAT